MGGRRFVFRRHYLERHLSVVNGSFVGQSHEFGPCQITVPWLIISRGEGGLSLPTVRQARLFMGGYFWLGAVHRVTAGGRSTVDTQREHWRFHGLFVSTALCFERERL